METPEQTAVEAIVFPAMQSASVGKLVAALAKAQAKIVAPKKSRTAKVRSSKGEGSSYEYQYADLEDTIESCKGPLADVGLAYYHFTTRMPGDARTWVVTRICLAETDEWIQTALPVAAVGNLQELGGCLTYLQKYNLRMLLGQSGGDRDDDGAGVVAGAQEDEEILEAKRRATIERLEAEKQAKYDSGKWRKLPPETAVDATVAQGLTPAATAVPASTAPTSPAPLTTLAPAVAPKAVVEKPHLAKLRAALAEEGATPEVFLLLPQVIKNFGEGAAWDALPPDFVGVIMEPSAWGRLKAALPVPF